MGVTASTPVNLVVGAGNVLIDGSDVGATTGDNIFRVVRTYFVPQLNGIPGPLVGTDYIQTETAELEVAFAEMTDDILELVAPNATATPSGADTRIWSPGNRRVASSQYHTYRLVVPGLDTHSFYYEVRRAIATGNAEFSAQDAGLMAPRITFSARWEAGSTGTEAASPWEIGVLIAGS
jgi:hypothetical protein